MLIIFYDACLSIHVFLYIYIYVNTCNNYGKGWWSRLCLSMLLLRCHQSVFYWLHLRLSDCTPWILVAEDATYHLSLCCWSVEFPGVYNLKGVLVTETAAFMRWHCHGGHGVISVVDVSQSKGSLIQGQSLVHVPFQDGLLLWICDWATGRSGWFLLTTLTSMNYAQLHFISLLIILSH